jgi:hypothetical protein
MDSFGNHADVSSLRRIPSGDCGELLSTRKQSQSNAISREPYFVQTTSAARLECLTFPHCFSTP